MSLVSSEPRAAGDLVSSELAAGDVGGCAEALAAQGAVPTLGGSTHEPFHSSSKDDGNKLTASPPAPAEM